MYIGRRAFLKSSLACMAYLGVSTLPFLPGHAETLPKYTFKTASSLGCILDCDVLTGLTAAGGAPTDNTAIINAYLATASVTNPIQLILDAGTACTGIVGPAGGYWTIEGSGVGAGIFVLSGSNNPAITNAPVTGILENGIREDALFANQSQSGSNIAIRDLYINGNEGSTFPNTNSTVSSDLQNNIFGILMFNVAGLRIEGCNLFNVPTFNVWMYGCTDVIVDGCKITSTTILQDGIHLSGPNSNVKITRNFISTGDDGIALNSPETQYVAANTGGLIDNIVISDNVFGNSLTAVRGYGNGTTAMVGRVVVSGNVGGVESQNGNTGAVHLLGNGIATQDCIQNFVSTGGVFQSNGFFVKIADSLGVVVLDDYTWDSPTNANPAITVLEPVTVSSFTLSKFRIYRTTRGSALAFGLNSTVAGAVFQRFVIDGVAVINEAGQSFSAIPFLIDLTDLTITELVINSLDPTNITALVNPSTGFGSVIISGPGVLATGYQIPDANMANDCYYISATSPNAGKVCIKLAGVVNVVTTTT
jgi:Glycosyl hydrolases family 28